MTLRHAGALTGSALLIFGVVGFGIVTALRVNPLEETSIIGAVITNDPDPHKQMPIAGASIAGTLGRATGTTTSNATGFFNLNIPSVLKLGRQAHLEVQRAGFKAWDATVPASGSLVVVRLEPLQRGDLVVAKSQHTVANVRIRYTERRESSVDIAKLVRTFNVENVGNRRCDASLPCSPSGEWRAATGGITLEAPAGDHLQSPRVSCIAGPCPFTRVEAEDLRNSGREFRVSALDWSDTTTFLVESDVVRTQSEDMVRESFPVIFGRGLSFTLPASAEGPCLEAEIDGVNTVFPLGPDLVLSWGTCTYNPNSDKSGLYTCELKPEFRF